MPSHSSLGLAAIVIAVFITPINVASAPPHRTSPTALLRSEPALSVGAPNAGGLVRGSKIVPSNHIRIVPAWSQPDVRWGLPELANMLQRAASKVSNDHGPCAMSLGDMSSRNGGALRRHKSHQSGRDVDIAFYMSDRDGNPMYHETYVEFDADGRASSLPAARFDDRRNWVLIEALLSDPKARVQNVFVAPWLRKRLLQEAERRGAARSIRLEAARVMSLPSGASPHADHFHIRIECPSNQSRACEPLPRLTTSDVEAKQDPPSRNKRRRGGTL